MTATKNRPLITINPETLTLSKGKHDRGNIMCAMEFASILANEEWGDSPKCVSFVFRELMTNFNDNVGDEMRNRLIPYVPKVLNTNDNPKSDFWRYHESLNWLRQAVVPAYLKAAGLEQEALNIQFGAPIPMSMLERSSVLQLPIARRIAPTVAALRAEAQAKVKLPSSETAMNHLKALYSSGARAVTDARIFMLAGSSVDVDYALTLYEIVEQAMWIITCNRLSGADGLASGGVVRGYASERAAHYALEQVTLPILNNFFSLLDSLIEI